jgi:hypothetical protein
MNNRIAEMPAHRITSSELEEMWKGKLSPRLCTRVAEENLQYRRLTHDERDAALRRVMGALIDPPAAAGPHRLDDWEAGWSENLTMLEKTRSLDSVVPKYFGKHQVVRWAGDFAQPLSKNFEYYILSFLVEWALETWLCDVDSIYEFGCGPGYHLLRARKLFQDKNLIGLDWTTASQRILKQIVESGLGGNIEGRRFNFFAPDYNLDMNSNSGIYSVAALEQVGDRHEELIQFLLNKKPRICVHIEPINELLDIENLIDWLSISYVRKRNYLHNYLLRLRELEKEGRLTIHFQKRTWTGSLFLEGHSLVVWSPL